MNMMLIEHSEEFFKKHVSAAAKIFNTIRKRNGVHVTPKTYHRLPRKLRKKNINGFIGDRATGYNKIYIQKFIQSKEV